MKIGFNGRFLAQPHTGIGQYTFHLLQAMSKLDPSVQWMVPIPEKLPSQAKENWPSSIHLELLPEAKLPTASLRKWFWEQVQVPRYFKQQQVTLAHYPYPANPRWGRFPFKTVVTVHDVIPWLSPEYRRHFRSRLYQANTIQALQKADHLIAVSRVTAEALHPFLKKSPLIPITVVHEAASPDFHLKSFPHKNPKPYLLYVGGYDPRKNVKTLIEAYQKIIQPFYEVDLILVGAKTFQKCVADPRYAGFSESKMLDKLMKSAIDPLHKNQRKGQIHLTDALSAKDLSSYYRGALAWVSSSLAEGFNLPILEAAACETPLLLSDIPIHREVAGEKALFYNPHSSEALGEALREVITKPHLRADLKKAAQQLSTKYSWEKAAQETLNFYNKSK